MTETTLVHSDYRHTCTHSCSKVMSKALAPTRCRCMTLAHQPRCLACAEDACNARLKSIPVLPRGAAGRAACSMHRGITSTASCVRRARCPAHMPSLRTRKVAALRGACRPTARCGAARSPPTATSTTAPVARVSTSEDAIKRALGGLFPQLGAQRGGSFGRKSWGSVPQGDAGRGALAGVSSQGEASLLRELIHFI